MTIFDSCIFIALFRIEESKHEEAKKLFKTSQNVLINDYILSEVYTVLLLRESYEIAQKALNWLVRHPKIEIRQLSGNEIKEIVDFITNNESKLSFVDISLLVMKNSNNCDLLTFDQELLKFF